MFPSGRLAASLARLVRHHQEVEDDEATQLMLEALFDVRAKVSEIHAVVVGMSTTRTRMAKKRKKKTPEERAAERAYQEDLDRRLREMIERYRTLNAEKRAAEGG